MEIPGEVVGEGVNLLGGRSSRSRGGNRPQGSLESGSKAAGRNSGTSRSWRSTCSASLGPYKNNGGDRTLSCTGSVACIGSTPPLYALNVLECFDFVRGNKGCAYGTDLPALKLGGENLTSA